MLSELIQIGSKQQTMLTTKMEVHGHELTLWMLPMNSAGYFMFLLSKSCGFLWQKRGLSIYFIKPMNLLQRENK